MAKEAHVQELITLKIIAETLNQATDLTIMLDTVLNKLLELTGLTTGWVFLVDGLKDYECVAYRQLPPALLFDNRAPMRCGNCWCLDRYGDGRLHNAVNIIGCKRIENAIEYEWGDTGGITHHATVPLHSGNRQFGVLNVAAPGKEHFKDEELALLQAVAFQVGSTIERMELYAAEQRRADLYVRLGNFSRKLGTAMGTAAVGNDPEQLVERAVALIGEHFAWSMVTMLVPAGDDYLFSSICINGQMAASQSRFARDAVSWLDHAAIGRCSTTATSAEIAELVASAEIDEVLPVLSSGLATSVLFSSSGSSGMLVVGYDKLNDSHRVDGEVIEALAEHIAVALERARLEQKRQELARLEERNRLARDLHDSVCQTLFSLSMTAKGVESLLASDSDMALSPIRDIQSLSQHALKEMRALIMQLRPTGLEAGLITSIKAYGERLNLHVKTEVNGIIAILPRTVEEALWRIGQEALNNVHKHAGTSEVEIVLNMNANEVALRISDRGRGISRKRLNAPTRVLLGLSTMRERAEALGGRFMLTSFYRKGTAIDVSIPFQGSSTKIEVKHKSEAGNDGN
jgi:two-component system NarL family sensor kinase